MSCIFLIKKIFWDQSNNKLKYLFSNIRFSVSAIILGHSQQQKTHHHNSHQNGGNGTSYSTNSGGQSSTTGGGPNSPQSGATAATSDELDHEVEDKVIGKRLAMRNSGNAGSQDPQPQPKKRKNSDSWQICCCIFYCSYDSSA